MKTSLTINRLLPLTFVSSAATGIGLHIAGHGSGHEAWHNLAATHVITSVIWLMLGAFHIKRHWHWYKAIASRGIGRKSRVTLALSAAFFIVSATGIVLITCVNGPGSIVGLWHYRLGLLLIIFSIIHIAKRNGFSIFLV